MNEDEILSTVRQLAAELRELPVGGKVTSCEAYRRLQSQPGKGGPLMQWFNRELDQARKNIISNILGHFARTAYQQKPEFNQNAADELLKLCDRLQPPVAPPPTSIERPAATETRRVAEETPIAIAQQAPPSDTVLATSDAALATSDATQVIADAADVKYQQAMELWNAGGLSWANITEQLGEDSASWKTFSQAVKRFAKKTEQTMRVGKAVPRSPD